MTTTHYNAAFIDGTAIFKVSLEEAARSSEGRPVPQQALANATNHIKRIMLEHRPRNMLIAHRPHNPAEKDDSLKQAYDHFKELADAMGIPQESCTDEQAYGFFQRLLKDNEASGRPALIVSDDALLGCCLSKDIHFEELSALRVFTHDDFVREYGFPPQELADFYALVGHASLAIDGVPFVGPATAARWLQEKGTADLVEHVTQQRATTKVGMAFSKNVDAFRQNQSRIKETLSQIPERAPSVLRTKIDRERLFGLYEKHQLFEMLPKENSGDHRWHSTRLDAVSAITSLKSAKSLAFYFEEDPRTGTLSGVGVSDGKHSHGFPLNLASDFDQAWLLSRLAPLCLDDTVPKVANNVKLYYKHLSEASPDIGSLQADATVLSYTLNSINRKETFEKLADKFIPDVEYNKSPYKIASSNGLDAAGKYLSQRASATLQLNRRIYEACRGTSALDYYRRLEEPVAKVIAKMERNGVAVDREKLLQTRQSLEENAKAILRRINRHLPKDERIDSLNRVNTEHLLYDVFKLKPPKITPTGARSVDSKSLKKLESQHRLPAEIRRHNELKQIVSNPITPILSRIGEGEGVIYPSFNQCSTITGRLSANDPNIQGIPIRTAEGKKVRQAFTAREGNVIVAADYSQVELRILAHISQDRNLINAFRQGQDIHAATAARMLNIDISKVTSEQRSSAKAVNFGIVYGLSEVGLAEKLGTSKQEASAFIQTYFNTFPGVANYLKKVSEEGVRQGYVETLGGRQIPILSTSGASTQGDHASKVRRSYNYPIQGTAAELAKEAMIAADNLIEEEFPDAKMIIQVHDELVFEVNEAAAPAFAQRISEVMSSCVRMTVPLDVDVHVGRSWDEEQSLSPGLVHSDDVEPPQAQMG